MRESTTGTDQQVEGVIKSMEVAYRMQTEAPEVFDVQKGVPGHARYVRSRPGRPRLP